MRKRFKWFQVSIISFVLIFVFSTASPAQSEENNIPIKPFELNFVYRAAGRGAPIPLTEGSTLYSGDHYKLMFTPTEECYVYIFQIDTMDKTQQIFPMEEFMGRRFHNVNPVHANQTYMIPTPDDWFRLDHNTGIERIYFWAMREPDHELERLLEKTKSQPDLNEVTTMQLMDYADQVLDEAYEGGKGFDAIVAPSEPVRWHEKGKDQAFTAVQQRLQNMCDGCFYVLTFRHK